MDSRKPCDNGQGTTSFPQRCLKDHQSHRLSLVRTPLEVNVTYCLSDHDLYLRHSIGALWAEALTSNYGASAICSSSLRFATFSGSALLFRNDIFCHGGVLWITPGSSAINFALHSGDCNDAMAQIRAFPGGILFVTASTPPGMLAFPL